MLVLNGCSFTYDPDFNYLSILAAWAIYEYEDTSGLPEFSYASPDHSKLAALCLGYGLDNIAGSGDAR